MENSGDKFIGKKTSQFSSLDETFGTQPTVIETKRFEIAKTEVVLTDKISNEEEENDLVTTRETLHRILKKSEDALDDLLYLAKQSEHPRTFEVAATLINTVTDVTDKILDVHKRKKELQSKNNNDKLLPGNIEQQNNIVFTGSPAELLKALKQEKERTIDE